MKHLKMIAIGGYKMLGLLIGFITIPLWLPIVLAHDAGCDNEKDYWLF
jgi:hypothetical protein